MSQAQAFLLLWGLSLGEAGPIQIRKQVSEHHRFPRVGGSKNDRLCVRPVTVGVGAGYRVGG